MPCHRCQPEYGSQMSERPDVKELNLAHIEEQAKPRKMKKRHLHVPPAGLPGPGSAPARVWAGLG